jgi:hypothetical protein
LFAKEQPMKRSTNRSLTSHEEELLRWVLTHGQRGAEAHIAAIAGLRVVGGCDCGCASIDFIEDAPGFGLEVLSDHQWRDKQGNLFGVFAFAKAGRIAGLEVWSVDGKAIPSELPDPAVLVPVS